MSGRRGGIKQKVNSENLYHPSKKPKSTRQEPHHLRSKSNQANQSSSKLESDIELSDMSLEQQQQPQPAQDEIQQQQPQLVQPDFTALLTMMVQSQEVDRQMRRAELTLEKEKLALVQEQLKDKQAKEETERKVKEVEQEKLDAQRMEERNQLMSIAAKDLENREQAKRDSFIERIPYMKEGQDVELRQSVEVELNQHAIPLAMWKKAVTSKLTPKIKNCVLDTLMSPTATYEDLKARIFKRAGKSINEIGSKLFDTLVKDSQGRKHRETIQQITQLLKRFFFEDSNKTEILTRLAAALLRTTLSVRQQDLLDTKTPNSFDALADFCDRIDSMEATRRLDRGNEGHGPRQQQRYQQHQRKWCSQCRRNNHNTAECRFLNSISPAKPSGSKVICYNCQEPGHTRPDCPKRNQPKKDLGERKESYNLKLPKSDKVERKVNFTTSQDKPKFVSGMVNGEVCNVLLDSGADIAVIPDYLVEPNQLLQEFYLVRGIHGHLIYRQKRLRNQ